MQSSGGVRLLAVSTAAISLTFVAPAFGTDSTPAPSTDSSNASQTIDVTSDDTHAQSTRSYARWPGKTISIRIALSGLKKEAAKRAIKDWNSANLKIKFKITTKKNSQVVIVEKKRVPCGGSACGDLGYIRGRQSKVTMTAGYKPSIYDAPIYSALVAHELGHILGLSHSSKDTQLMYPYINHVVKLTETGACRFYNTEDLKRVKKMYGGKGTMAVKSSCRFAPAAGKVSGLKITRDETTVRLSWNAASNASAYSVVRSSANGTCPANPRSGTRLDLNGRTAFDYSLTEGKRYCYRVFSYNKEGYLNPSGVSLSYLAKTSAPAAPTGAVLAVDTENSNDWYAAYNVSGVTDMTRYAAKAGSCATAPADSIYLNTGYPELTIDRYEMSGNVCVRFWNARTNFNGDDTLSSPVDRWITVAPAPSWD